jgi:trehalose synthase
MEQPAATHEAMNGRKNGIPTDHEYELGGDGRVELLKDISVGAQSIAAYTSAMGEEKIEELRSLAADMRDARVLHVNSTAYGGGVAELLRSHIPLLRSLGVDAHWVTIRGDESFFNVTKGFHNALQGGEYHLDAGAKEVYLSNNSRNVRCLNADFDYIVVHDPQPAAMRLLHGSNDARWVWRCHIDTSNPDPDVWEFLRPYVEAHDAAVFTMQQYVSPDLPKEKVFIMPPAIDPLSPKNVSLSRELCKKIIGWVGISTDRPLLTQVSRFDPWKDPLGVVEVYRKVREHVPGLQLALLGHLAMDDPEGWRIYDQVVKETRDDPDIYLFTNYTAASSIEVNAFQSYSDVVIQKSIKEGFGLVVAEALWKGTPVVAGRAGGIPMQLEDGEGGFLVESIDECADRVLYLLRNPKRARRMGRRGRQHIRGHFLTPRLLSDELKLLRSLK